MSEDRKNASEQDQERAAAVEEAIAEAEALAREAEEASAAGREAEGTPETDPVETLRAENAQLRDNALRAMADAQNARRRADEEIAKSRKYGHSAFAKDIVSVADNLSRALEAVPTEARDAAGEAVRNLIVGLEMIDRELIAVLDRYGVKKIDPKGEKFSYERHQAIQELEGTGQPAGTVVHVLQAGYMLHDRLLRPAMVIVAKGDAAPPSAGDGAPDGVDVTA